MSTQAESCCEFLPWDTDFFGCRIGRVRNDTLVKEQVLQIDEWSRDNHIRCLYFLARPDDPATIRIAETHGFGLVDVRLTLERRVRPSDAATCRQLPSDAVIGRLGRRTSRACRGSPAQRTAIRVSSTMLISRALGWKNSIRSGSLLECEGRAQKVFVAAGPAGQPLGYISCHLESSQNKGQIGLVGVAHEARGKGLGSSLVLAALDWFAAQGAKDLAVVTQGRNVACSTSIPELRLSDRPDCGFGITNGTAESHSIPFNQKFRLAP